MDKRRMQAGLDRHLVDLRMDLLKGPYCPKPVKRGYIPKANGKLRPLGIPTLTDRMVQRAMPARRCSAPADREIARGFVYLAVILDALSRRVVGYAIDHRLALAALEATIESRKPPSGCIHHTDRGSQYAAQDYRAMQARHGLRGSMGRRGNPCDNAKAESFKKALKAERVYTTDYESFEDVYNARRLHSALGYTTPIEFEENHAA